jgi:hypothetical protein
MSRILLVLSAAAGLAGCTTTNDSGVVLLRKPDLSTVVPGTPIDKVASLKNPLKKEPIIAGDQTGAETWIYEWDLPDDGVNNRMFTSVVVKNGLIVSFREDTADKWEQDAQLHRDAKLDSALEDVTALKVMAARYQRVASLRDNYNAAPQAETLDLLTERARMIQRETPLVAASASQDGVSAENASAPAPPPPAEPPAVASATSAVAAPSDAATGVAAPRKTLRELEAEELQIRKDSSLTKKERMRRLHEVWKLQREVTSGEGALAES